MVNTMKTINAINKDIDTLAKSEKVTKRTLAILSRDVLEYVYLPNKQGVVSEDISPINRILSVLTPVNKSAAILFFKNFLAWRYDDVANVFTKKNKKQYANKLTHVELFLANEDSNIWSWIANNVKVEVKEIDWTSKLTKDFVGALDAGLSFNDILTILEAALPEADAIKEAA